MRIAVDTNRYRDFCVGVPEAVELFRKASRIMVPFVTLAELRAGFLAGTGAGSNARVLAAFLIKPRVQVLLPDEDTMHHYARIWFQLRRQGTPIPTNDVWIAAIAVQHNLMLYSHDAHFDQIGQLVRA
jgi:tRNA(fMet)-specific endonuclease VapC